MVGILVVIQFCFDGDSETWLGDEAIDYVSVAVSALLLFEFYGGRNFDVIFSEYCIDCCLKVSRIVVVESRQEE